MPETNKREVNDDTEVIDADKIPDGETVDDGDETVIDAVDEDAEEATASDEGEDTASDDDDSNSSQEDDDQEDTDGDTSATDDGTANADHSQSKKDTKKPAPVPGETSREKALREELTRVRQKNRDLSMGKLVDKDSHEKAAPAEEQKMSDTDVEKLHAMGYDDQEIANMENAIDILASRKGYVKSSTLQNQSEQVTVNTLLTEFTKNHPEYLPANDADDIRWNKFYEILKSGMYNIRNKTPDQVARIYKRVHEDVIEELGEPELSTQDRKTAAQKQKIASVSHSGGNKSSAPAKKAVAKSSSKVDPAVRSMFKGFDDDDFAE